MSIFLIKLSDFVESLISTIWQLIIGFRLTTWEISQLIMSDVRNYEHLGDLSPDNKLPYATRIYSHASTLGFFHFVRGLRYAARRDPSIATALSTSLELLIVTPPVTLDQFGCHDYFFVIDRLKSFYHVIPHSKSLSSSSHSSNSRLERVK